MKTERNPKDSIIITTALRLIPYYPAYDEALTWYQDAELCHQVDNKDRVYDLSILKNMYGYLSSHGDLYYIESEDVLCGDVCLQTSGEISIVVCKKYQNRHIGRAVIGKILELAQEKGYVECFAKIYSFNVQSRKMFASMGFVQKNEETFVYDLKKETLP